MAAVSQLSVLLFALINNIHAEERIIIRAERDYMSFYLPTEADSCLISRFVGEDKLVLWNTSDLWPQNSTLPEDLKQRLSVFSWGNTSSYVIDNLTHSDSGPYQEECWTDGKVTHENNITITICSAIESFIQSVSVITGRTVDLPCWGAADNLDFQWLKRDFRYPKEIWTRVFEDNTTSVTDDVIGRYQVVRNSLHPHVSNHTTTDIKLYNCLVMSQQQCVSSHRREYKLFTEITYHSVEETAVLPCTVTDSTYDLPARWFNSFTVTQLGQEDHTGYSVDQNNSLVLSWLMLNHSGRYFCQTFTRTQTYQLLVCPKFGPPAVELFSEGENVTLRCKDWEKGVAHAWFIKSNHTEGRVFTVTSDLSMLSRVRGYPNGSLVISNVSVKDSGEYWCAVTDLRFHCVSNTKTLLMYIEPFGVHSTFYKVRCSVLSVLLVMQCVVVVAVNQWVRRGEQLSAHTHS